MSALRTAGNALLGAAAAFFVVVYLVIALSRMGYPYELEWMEGGMVQHVDRVLAGSPIYAKPSMEFVSFFYPPLYYEAAAGLARVLGSGFLPLRLLSLLSSLGVFGLLFAIVVRQTRSRLAGLSAAGLFAACFNRTGGWFDIARLDSFYLLLVLASVHALGGTGMASAAGAGLLIGAAFLTKQSALVIALPLALYAVVADRRRGAMFCVSATLVMGGGFLGLDRATAGWFRYYCFALPARHPRVPGGWLAFFTHDLGPGLAIAALLAAGYAVFRMVAGAGRERFFLPAVALGMIGSSWSVRNMLGAEVNNLLPALAAIAILAALATFELGRGARPGSTGRTVALAAPLLLTIQLAALAYDPRKHLPTAADRAAGDRLIARLAKISGEIYTPHHGYLARLVDKRAYAHTLAIDNVILDDPGSPAGDLQIEIVQALREQRFGAVLLESDGRYGAAIRQGYEPVEPLFTSPDVFWPVTGGRLRPEVLCLPRNAVEDRTR